MSKIALVDDDRNILTSVSMTLEAEGFEVETYNDGQAALDAFNRKLPDMAVLDIKMPRMDGMDLLQRLRQNWQRISATQASHIKRLVAVAQRLPPVIGVWHAAGVLADAMLPKQSVAMLASASADKKKTR